MGKLPIARIFDTAIIATTKAYQELEPFIGWVQNTIEIFYRTLNGNVTIENNLAATTFTWSVKSTATVVTDTISLGRKPIVLIVAQQNPITPVITSFTWKQVTAGQTQVTFYFSSAPTLGVNVTVLAFFA